MQKGKMNFRKHTDKLNAYIGKMPAFLAVMAVAIALATAVFWLASSVTGKVENENELFKKRNEDRNAINNTGSEHESIVHANKSDLRAVACNGGNIYVAVGSMGKIFISADGIKWSEIQLDINKTFWGVVWGKKQFVAVGNEGTIIISKNGTNWKLVDSGVNTALLEVAWDGQRYIACGNGAIITSHDGIAWTDKEVPDIALNNNPRDKISYNIVDVFWDGKQYIAAGGGNFILSSEDLDMWVVRVPNSLGNGILCDIAFNDERYIAVGDHMAMMTSPDGHKWTDEGLNISNIDSVDDAYTLCLWSVVWGRGKFIAAGHRGLILASADGLNWSVIPPITSSGINHVFWDGGKYIAVGNNETVIVSADGENWTAAFMEYGGKTGRISNGDCSLAKPGVYFNQAYLRKGTVIYEEPSIETQPPDDYGIKDLVFPPGKEAQKEAQTRFEASVKNEESDIVIIKPDQIIKSDPEFTEWARQKTEEFRKPITGLFNATLDIAQDDNEVKLDFFLQNISDGDLSLDFNLGREVDFFVINSGGEEVYRWSHGKDNFLPAITHTKLFKGKKLSFTKTWDYMDNGGSRVLPGKYSITVKLSAKLKNGKIMNPDELTAVKDIEVK